MTRPKTANSQRPVQEAFCRHTDVTTCYMRQLTASKEGGETYRPTS